MGRHARHEYGAVTTGDARLVVALPGWSLFATLVAAVCVRLAGTPWTAVGGVGALGLGSAAALWWSIRQVQPGATSGADPEGHEEVAVAGTGAAGPGGPEPAA